MESKGELCFGAEGDFNTPICEDDLNDEVDVPYHQFSQDTKNRLQKESKFSLNRGKMFQMAVGILALLAAVLLIVTISLGVHYYRITHSHQTMDETKRINEEMKKLNETYKTKFKSMTNAKNQLTSELNHMEQTKWEFEHLTESCRDVKKKVDEVTGEITKLRSQFIITEDDCKHCPPGWILINAMCFYFPFSTTIADKNWAQAREFCQLQGGDLAILDSKDKQNSTVTFLRKHQDLSKTLKGFWIGLTDSVKEGTWKWVNGKFLEDGYWNVRDMASGNKDCASVFARENFFKSWNEERCSTSLKWICEKNITNASS